MEQRPGITQQFNIGETRLSQLLTVDEEVNLSFYAANLANDNPNSLTDTDNEDGNSNTGGGGDRGTGSNIVHDSPLSSDLQQRTTSMGVNNIGIGTINIFCINSNPAIFQPTPLMVGRGGGIRVNASDTAWSGGGGGAASILRQTSLGGSTAVNSITISNINYYYPDSNATFLQPFASSGDSASGDPYLDALGTGSSSNNLTISSAPVQGGHSSSAGTDNFSSNNSPRPQEPSDSDQLVPEIESEGYLTD